MMGDSVENQDDIEEQVKQTPADNNLQVISDTATAETAEVNEADGNKVPSPKRRRLSKKYLLAGLIVILAFGIGVFGTLLFTKSSQNNNQASTTNQQASGSLPNTSTAKTTTTPVTDTITWLDTPKQLALQPVFDSQWFNNTFQDGSKIEDVFKFYQVGSIGDSQLIMAFVDNGIGSQTMLLKKTGSSYILYQQHSTDTFSANTEGGPVSYQGPTLTSAVTIDKTSVIGDILPAQTLNINGQDFTLSKYGALGIDFITATDPPSNTGLQYKLIKTDNSGKLYQAISKDDPVYQVSYFTLMTKDHRMHPYIIKGAVFNQGVPPITWSDGSTNSISFASAVGGCGFSDSTETAKQITESSLTTIGKTSDGKTVYITTSTSDPLFVKHYDEYKSFMTYAAGSLPASESNLTADQFKQNHGFYIIKDDSGRWVVMARAGYFPQGGCAKPVVYLYPSVATLVNVKIGANVTKSDPYYPSDGWAGVLAQPNGTLRYSGNTYGSLFWEGFGHGNYPAIQSGAYIKRDAVEFRIRGDLAAQGLNAKEVNDFWAFWANKVPATPYVRITWLSKQQLQVLAPLYVTPKPDTVIRVFLDMEGADKPSAIIPQRFETPKRNGFTVVEWGGLARDGSVPRAQ